MRLPFRTATAAAPAGAFWSEAAPRRRSRNRTVLFALLALLGLVLAYTAAVTGMPRLGGAADTLLALSPDTPGAAVTPSPTAEPWLRVPYVQRVHPPFPGAVIDDARFLAGGAVVLTVHFPPGPWREAWLFDAPAPAGAGSGSVDRNRD
ncbi:MAG: hypothetical protein M3442_11980, partial [Chloroflexota bacterium]|nr:hypothetical protein [Chloroflexota bacterium]